MFGLIREKNIINHNMWLWITLKVKKEKWYVGKKQRSLLCFQYLSLDTIFVIQNVLRKWIIGMFVSLSIQKGKLYFIKNESNFSWHKFGSSIRRPQYWVIPCLMVDWHDLNDTCRVTLIGRFQN